MIRSNSKLSDEEVEALQNLASSCHRHDGGTPTFYYHLLTQKRISENNIMYWQGSQLLGFLSVYFFYHDACEVSLLVAREHRREGIATQLVTAIMPLLKTRQIKTLIFSTAAQYNNDWLRSLGCNYRNSEYHMVRNEHAPILLPRNNLQVRMADFNDIPILQTIDNTCFNGANNDVDPPFRSLLNDNSYTLLLASANNAVVGKAHIHWQTKDTVLSDIAILPQYQGRGLGKELLTYCINYALVLQRPVLSLDVDASNKVAINLYKSYKFATVRTTDYWRIPMEDLIAKWQL